MALPTEFALLAAVGGVSGLELLGFTEEVLVLLLPEISREKDRRLGVKM